MELEFFVGIEACGHDFLEAGENPPIDEGEGFRRGGICSVVVVEIRQKDAQRVANAPVGIRETREDFLRERNIVGEVHTTDPEAQKVGTVFVHIMVGIRRFLISTGSGLRDFLAGVDIHHESMGEHGAVGGAVIQGNGSHERTLEPAAVLIGSFEVEISGEAEFGALAHDGLVAEAGVHPHIKGVVATGRSCGQTNKGTPCSVIHFEPRVRAFFRKNIRHFANHDGIEEWLAFGIVENRQWHAPCALAGDAPIRPGLHGATNTVATPVREPCGGIDFFEGLGADVFDADEELLDGAEDDRRLGAPAVRVGVFVGALSSEGTFLIQELDDACIRLKDIFADKFGQPALLGVASVVIDGGKQREPTLHAEMVVVLAMAWRDMNATCAGIQRHKSRGMNRCIARQEGMTGLEALQFRAGDCFFDGKFFSSGGCAERVQKGFGENDGFFNALETHADHGVLVAGVDGDSEVRGQCPRGGRPDHNGSLACEFSTHEREENIDGG